MELISPLHLFVVQVIDTKLQVLLKLVLQIVGVWFSYLGQDFASNNLIILSGKQKRWKYNCLLVCKFQYVSLLIVTIFVQIRIFD